MHVTEIAKIYGHLTALRKEVAELLMLIGLDEVNLIINPDLKDDREFTGNLERMRGRNEKLLKHISEYKKQLEEAKKGYIDTTPLPEFRAQPIPMGGLN